YFPTNVEEIKFRTLSYKKIMNLDKLTKLKILHEHSFTGFGDNTTLDFSNCPLEEIKRAAFQWSNNNITIILPATVKKVDPFILFYTEKNGKYNILNSPSLYTEQDLETIELTSITNVNIKIKGIETKPEGWSKYWVGQYWREGKPNGKDGELKITWNYNS
ncbi:hypothetical protein, partial [Metamycoplasma hyosynoviae]|uniref:hypothetical protein n=1 Tax=Metamycoplasma hyosynoviae TaxID=29559 RepID=UPI00236723D2